MIIRLRIVDKRYRFDTAKTSPNSSVLRYDSEGVMLLGADKASRLSDHELKERFRWSICRLYPAPRWPLARTDTLNILGEMARRSLAQDRLFFGFKGQSGILTDPEWKPSYMN